MPFSRPVRRRAADRLAIPHPLCAGSLIPRTVQSCAKAVRLVNPQLGDVPERSPPPPADALATIGVRMTQPKRYYLTTSIPYVNNRPGLHTLYEVIGADVIARWYRMNGVPTRFLTGADEHSVNIHE